MGDKLTVNSWILEHGGSLQGYRSYSAWVKQDSPASSNPVASVLENTLGAPIIWTRLGTGNYYATIQDGVTFPTAKTVCPPFGNYGDFSTPWLPIHAGPDGLVGYYTLYQISSTQLLMTLVNAAGVSTDLNDLMGVTSLFVEIRVYP